jgi:hypothetical protein
VEDAGPYGPRIDQSCAAVEGDRVRIADGPAKGLIGEVLCTNPAADTAYVKICVPALLGDQLRTGIAVVSLDNVLALSDAGIVTDDPPRRRGRGRPRLISDHQIQRMCELYRTGLYSHADIAYILGVSTSSVTTWLRKRSQSEPAAADHQTP